MLILVRSTHIFGHLQLKLQSVKKNQTVCFAFFYKQYKYSTTSHRTKTFLQAPQLTCGSPCVRVVLVHARTSLPADIPFSTPRPSVSLLLRSGLEPALFKRPQLHFIAPGWRPHPQQPSRTSLQQPLLLCLRRSQWLSGCARHPCSRALPVSSCPHSLSLSHSSPLRLSFSFSTSDV